jgi:hypothetical protein
MSLMLYEQFGKLIIFCQRDSDFTRIRIDQYLGRHTKKPLSVVNGRKIFAWPDAGANLL